MSKLSISKAWDETKAEMGEDGRLFARIALALIGFTTMISTLIAPGGIRTGRGEPLWVESLSLMFMIAALIGQLALVRLALKPPLTVGQAINHGARRMPVYFVSVVIMVCILLLAAVPIVLILSALGIPLQSSMTEVTPGVWLAAALLIAAALAMAARMLMTTPVACAEHVGPIKIIRRSWELTRGHWLHLLGFLLAILLVALVLLTVIGMVIGTIVTVAFGPIERLSVSALLVGIVQGLFNAAFSAFFAVMLTRIYVQLSKHPTADPPRTI